MSGDLLECVALLFGEAVEKVAADGLDVRGRSVDDGLTPIARQLDECTASVGIARFASYEAPLLHPGEVI